MRVMKTCQTSGSFDDFGWLEFGTEHPVPETAGYSKSILVVGEMVLQVVLLELTII